MLFSRVISVFLLVTMIAACTTNPYTGEREASNKAKGAAIGAVLGGIRAWKKNKAYKERQKRLAELEIDSEIEHNRLNFKNAFSACLTSRDYVVR